MSAVFGWDVGGAHVKVSMTSRAGVLEDVAQWACPLWQGIAHLERVRDRQHVRALAACCGKHRASCSHDDRRDGRSLHGSRGRRTHLVAHAGATARSAAHAVLCRRCLARAFRMRRWLAQGRIGELALQPRNESAACMPHALLVDIGSTTTDIIPIVDGKVMARGSNDADRLVSGELIYQGVVRTPCGVAHCISRRNHGRDERMVCNDGRCLFV